MDSNTKLFTLNLFYGLSHADMQGQQGRQALRVAKRYDLAPAVESDLLEQATNRATNTSVLYTRIFEQIGK